jgi:acyl-CoA synthetase (AMP-forming)/AMP-acid ligase II
MIPSEAAASIPNRDALAPLASPSDEINGANRSQNCWLLGFRLQLYAGLQVLGQSLADRGSLVIPGQESNVSTIVTMMATAGVTHASATPSYWRRLLIFGDRSRLATVPLKQITLGGEMADQPLLDALRGLFPGARITHIYATTELGRCFAISDGLAGFPEELLIPGSIRGVELAVREGELYARSLHAAAVGPTLPKAGRFSVEELPWIATGDLVTILAGRVQFTGRKSELINVGGNKVHPAIVEQVIRGVDGVQDVLVYPHASSIAGFLVACQVVPNRGQPWDELRQRIFQVCHAKLRRHEVPRILEAVAEITLSPAGKKRRSPVTTEKETS